MFDSYDFGNGNFDVETSSDRKRWTEDAFQTRKEEDRQTMTKEEWDEKYNRCPY